MLICICQFVTNYHSYKIDKYVKWNETETYPLSFCFREDFVCVWKWMKNRQYIYTARLQPDNRDIQITGGQILNRGRTVLTGAMFTDSLTYTKCKLKYEEFHLKMQHLYFSKFEIFAIEATKI